MGVETTILEAIQRMKDEKEKAIRSIAMTLKSLNPKLDGVDHHEKYMTVMSSSLTKNLNLSPFHYDIPRQIEYLVVELNKRTLESFMDLVKRIVISNGNKVNPEGINFHPLFISQLKKALYNK